MKDSKQQRQLAESIKKQHQTLIHTDKQDVSDGKSKEIEKQLRMFTEKAHNHGHINTELKTELEKQIHQFNEHHLPGIGVVVCYTLREAIEK